MVKCEVCWEGEVFAYVGLPQNLKDLKSSLCGVNQGTHTQLIPYHTIGAWGTGSDDVGLIQSTKAPKGWPRCNGTITCSRMENTAHPGIPAGADKSWFWREAP